MPRSRESRRHHRFEPVFLTLLAGALVVACNSTGVVTTSPPATPQQATTPSTAPGAPTVRPVAQPSSSCATTTLNALTEGQRVGQLFMLGVDGDRLSADETAAIKTYHIGSVFLVNRRTGGIDGIRPLTRDIQALATAQTPGGVGFFTAADQEGGEVQRLNGPGFSTIPSGVGQGKLAPDVLANDAAGWGRELVAAGVNVNLAPVMDVVPPGADATNKPIGALDREFGHDPATVGSHGAAVVRGLKSTGVATTLKHFPGLGRVAGNTDTAAGVVDSATTVDDPYLAAFRAGIDAGAPMVMVSLATYAAIDPGRPAVFSPAIIGVLLRQRFGFEGVVISDDLGATASVASMPAAQRAIDFILAGGDLVLVEGTTPAIQMAAAVAARAVSDAAFKTQVDTAALRMLEAKSSYGLLACGAR
jgi:beta-N-acetylhexosaminidase